MIEFLIKIFFGCSSIEVYRSDPVSIIIFIVLTAASYALSRHQQKEMEKRGKKQLEGQISPTYAGEEMADYMGSRHPIPVAFGKVKLPGAIIRRRIGRGTTNVHQLKNIVWCEGEINSYEQLYVHDLEWQYVKDENKDKWEYSGTDGQNVEENPDSGCRVDDWPDPEYLRGIAHSIILNDIFDIGVDPNYTIVIEGKKLRTCLRGAVGEAWSWDDDNSIWTDETTDINDDDANDVLIHPSDQLNPDGWGAEDDALYIGNDTKFWGVYINMNTAVSSESVKAWEYWDGSSWSDLPKINDDTNGLQQDGDCCWKSPSNWTKTTLAAGGSSNYYWIRIRETVNWRPPLDFWAQRAYIKARSGYSRNPADIMVYAIVDVWNRDEDEIDITKFEELYDYCDSVPTGGVLERYRYDYVKDYVTPLADWMKHIGTSYFGTIVWSQGKLRPVWKQTQASSAFDFTEDWNVVRESLKFEQPEKNNLVYTFYIASEMKYSRNVIRGANDYDIRKRGEYKSEDRASFLTDGELARRRCWVTLNESQLNNYNVSFMALPSAAAVEVLDKVTLTTRRPEPDWDEKELFVLERRLNFDGSIEFDCMEYYDIYGTSNQIGEEYSGEGSGSSDGGEEVDPTPVPEILPVTNLALEEVECSWGESCPPTGTKLKVTYDSPDFSGRDREWIYICWNQNEPIADETWNYYARSWGRDYDYVQLPAVAHASFLPKVYVLIQSRSTSGRGLALGECPYDSIQIVGKTPGDIVFW